MSITEIKWLVGIINDLGKSGISKFGGYEQKKWESELVKER